MGATHRDGGYLRGRAFSSHRVPVYHDRRVVRHSVFLGKHGLDPLVSLLTAGEREDDNIVLQITVQAGTEMETTKQYKLKRG